MHPVHTGEGKQQLRESSKHFHQHFTSTVRALISFSHTNASFLLISHQQNIDPTQFCSCFSWHGLPWQNPPVLSMFNLNRAGETTKPKGHTWCPRWVRMFQGCLTFIVSYLTFNVSFLEEQLLTICSLRQLMMTSAIIFILFTLPWSHEELQGGCSRDWDWAGTQSLCLCQLNLPVNLITELMAWSQTHSGQIGFPWI